jgi:hypothetical protein
VVGKSDGFQYVRFHGIFQNDMFVYREDEHGNPIYNFQYVDDIYDRMLAKGNAPLSSWGSRQLLFPRSTTRPSGGVLMAARLPITRSGRTWSGSSRSIASTAMAPTRCVSGISKYGMNRISISHFSVGVSGKILRVIQEHRGND